MLSRLIAWMAVVTWSLAGVSMEGNRRWSDRRAVQPSHEGGAAHGSLRSDGHGLCMGPWGCSWRQLVCACLAPRSSVPYAHSSRRALYIGGPRYSRLGMRECVRACTPCEGCMPSDHRLLLLGRRVVGLCAVEQGGVVQDDQVGERLGALEPHLHHDCAVALAWRG